MYYVFYDFLFYSHIIKRRHNPNFIFCQNIRELHQRRPQILLIVMIMMVRITAYIWPGVDGGGDDADKDDHGGDDDAHDDDEDDEDEDVI